METIDSRIGLCGRDMWKVHLSLKEEYAAALANCSDPFQGDQVYLEQAEAAQPRTILEQHHSLLKMPKGKWQPPFFAEVLLLYFPF